MFGLTRSKRAISASLAFLAITFLFLHPSSTFYATVSVIHLARLPSYLAVDLISALASDTLLLELTLAVPSHPSAQKGSPEGVGLEGFVEWRR
jgi:hypothetical protein